jgi:hypothetical protein
VEQIQLKDLQITLQMAQTAVPKMVDFYMLMKNNVSEGEHTAYGTIEMLK